MFYTDIISLFVINCGFEYLSDSLKQIFIADMRERLTGEDLGHTQILAELDLFDGDFNQWKNEKQVVKGLDVALKILQGGVKKRKNDSQNFQKEIEKKVQEITELKKRNNF